MINQRSQKKWPTYLPIVHEGRRHRQRDEGTPIAPLMTDQGQAPDGPSGACSCFYPCMSVSCCGWHKLLEPQRTFRRGLLFQ